MTTRTRPPIWAICAAAAVVLALLAIGVVATIRGSHAATDTEAVYTLPASARTDGSSPTTLGQNEPIRGREAPTASLRSASTAPRGRLGTADESVFPPAGNPPSAPGTQPSGSAPPSSPPGGAPPGSSDNPPTSAPEPDNKPTTTTTVVPKTTTTVDQAPTANCGDLSVSAAGFHDVYTYWISQDCFSDPGKSTLQAFSTQGTFGKVTAPSDSYCSALAGDAWCWLYTPTGWDGNPYWDAFNVWVVDDAGNQSDPIRIDLCVNC